MPPKKTVVVKRVTTIKEVRKEYKSDSKPQNNACFRCGRTSHWVANCYARTHVDGKTLSVVELDVSDSELSVVDLDVNDNDSDLSVVDLDVDSDSEFSEDASDFFSVDESENDNDSEVSDNDSD